MPYKSCLFLQGPSFQPWRTKALPFTNTITNTTLPGAHRHQDF